MRYTKNKPARALLAVASAALTVTLIIACESPTTISKRKIGVALLVHGGVEHHSLSSTWDSTMQIFSYDPNSFVYQNVIWNPEAWPRILELGNAPKELGKYGWEFARIGGHDPAMDLSRRQLVDMTAELEGKAAELGVKFVTDYVSWIGDPSHLAHPRAIYTPGVSDGSPVTYCGSQSDGGTEPDYTWPGCDTERYDVAGTIDRMLAAGVDEIVVIDLTTSGVRFFKSNDVIRLSRAVIDSHNEQQGTAVTLSWLNDPQDLMRDSYPDKPANWTNSLGAPEHDPSVPLADRPNPVAADLEFALLHAQGIEAQLNREVLPENTGVLLVNHATRRFNQLFDPKIDDTLILNANIRDLLIERNPGLDPANVVGAWMGVKEKNPHIQTDTPGAGKLERTRRMRGENLGHAYLYETDERLPEGEWGYRYWHALEYLKDQGVEHIVVAFPQITVDSVLNLVELPNQIAKEIGYRSWLHIDTPDFDAYPNEGHPFADYWGIWVETHCKSSSKVGTMVPCCFEMGGCADDRPYPPVRLASFDKPRNDLDPSLAWDVSAYGHLGYNADAGKPGPHQPVQAQYAGTWATWNPPNADPRIGQLLAKHVIAYVKNSDNRSNEFAAEK
jgi:hypothetical protein